MTQTLFDAKKIKRFSSFIFFMLINMVLVSGCHAFATQTSMEKAKQKGSTIPRNTREKLIFDYFQHLQTQRYEEAYRMRAWYLAPQDISVAYFQQQHQNHHDSIPLMITIGQETKRDANEFASADCAYTYDVYAVQPGSPILHSGTVALASDPDQPETCLIAYNSAFGSVP